MERTLIILKPDCVEKRLCGTVISRFEQEGFSIVGCKVIQLTSEVLREHYAHITQFPFYPEVEKFMSSTSVIVIVFEGESIIDRTREFLGVTDCKQAAPGTIRAEHGSKEDATSKMMNIAHASDSAETAQGEIKRFFTAEELF